MAKIEGSKVKFDSDEDLYPVCENCLEPLNTYGKCPRDCTYDEELDMLENIMENDVNELTRCGKD